MAALSATASPDRQEKCTNQAREEFVRTKWEGIRASFTSHYNTRQDKCLMEIENVGVSNVEEIYTNKLLVDANGREYAAYLEFSKNGDESGDLPPSICEVYLSSGEQIECHSSQEFDKLVEDYMK